MANPDGSFDVIIRGKKQRVMPPQTSIHPRVRNGKTVYPKVNTAKKKAAKP